MLSEHCMNIVYCMYLLQYQEWVLGSQVYYLRMQAKRYHLQFNSYEMIGLLDSRYQHAILNEDQRCTNSTMEDQARAGSRDLCS